MYAQLVTDCHPPTIDSPNPVQLCITRATKSSSLHRNKHRNGVCHRELKPDPVIYGHRNMKARLPVRSALVKHVIARLVLQWVTMRESLVP